MNRRARRRARHGGGRGLGGGPRWAALGRGLRRQVRAGSRAAARRRNELLITALYAVAGALCLALAALLLTATVATPPTDAAVAPGRGLRGEVIGAVLLSGLGLLLLGRAAATLRAWWQRRA